MLFAMKRAILLAAAAAFILCLQPLRADDAAPPKAFAPKLKITEKSLGKMMDGLVEYSLTISPDSRHVAYVLKQEEKERIVFDGVQGKQYDEVMGMAFSEDSKRSAYIARRAEKWLVIVDGVEGKEYDGVNDLVFSPDSKRFAFAAERDEKCFIVLDGVEGKEYDGVRSPVFSSDSRNFAYVGMHKASKSEIKSFAVIDGVKGKEYDRIVRWKILCWRFEPCRIYSAKRQKRIPGC